MFLPLVKSTLENVEAQGTVAALTGPLSRGDTPTIAGHLVALAADAPDLLAVYTSLGLATLDLVEARGELDRAALDSLRLLLEHARDYDYPYRPRPTPTGPSGPPGPATERIAE